MVKGIDDPFYWLSFNWFLPETVAGFVWQYPDILFLVLGLPILFLLRWLFYRKSSQKLTVAFPKKEIKWHPSSLLRFVPLILLLFSLIFLIISLARPQVTNEKVEQWSEGIDIMLLIDISESMLIEDFKPNRLEAAKQVAHEFVDGRFQDRIGLVVFSGDAYSMSPLTTDYTLLKTYIDEIDHRLIEKGGTAIGSAIAVGTNRLRESLNTSKVMILLSDGENTAGNIDPITAAELAHAFDIKIYSVAIGREGRVPFGKDFFGRPRYVENNLDETALRKIASIGEGQFFRVSDNQAMEEVFKRIDQYEKVEIKETRFKDTADYYGVYLTWGIIFFIGWMGTKATFMSNVLED
ncbi:MAG: VWA domain-containing protein [Bacteroidota bacterium]|nr:VWA domain-containing protein [Bacteroidota bacterium]